MGRSKQSVWLRGMLTEHSISFPTFPSPLAVRLDHVTVLANEMRHVSLPGKGSEKPCTRLSSDARRVEEIMLAGHIASTKW